MGRPELKLVTTPILFTEIQDKARVGSGNVDYELEHP
jgi:hypothetical protein